MSKGFLVVAENNNNVDFIRMAYALSLSLKKTQSAYSKLSILTTTPIEDIEYSSAFDKVIVFDKDETWKEKSKSLDTTSLCCKYYDVTPYDETIVLDADFLFTHDISEWWDIFSSYDLLFTTTVKTYRGHEITSDYHRKVFTENSLPNIYTGMFYFKKSDIAQVFFNLVKVIFENWQEFFNRFLNDNYKPTFLSADVAYALAYKLLDLPDYTHLKVPVFTHMKTKLQNIENLQVNEQWRNILPVSLSNNQLKINNYLQTIPFHYHDKLFLSEELISEYETVHQL